MKLQQLGKGQTKIVVVVMNDFKLSEAEPPVTITKQKMTNFVLINIVCYFGIPYSLVPDKYGQQFDNANFKPFCSIKHYSSLLAINPKANGQVKSVNKIIKTNLKAKLECLKGAWMERDVGLLNNRAQLSTSETPFHMAFGAEVVVLVLTGLSSHKILLWRWKHH